MATMIAADAQRAVPRSESDAHAMDAAAIRLATIYGAVGLSGSPFSHDPASGPFVAIPSHARAMATLLPWLGRSADAGLALVTGCPGSGRTRLMRHLGEMLASRSDLAVAIVQTSDDRRTDAQMLRAIIGALGGEPTGRTGLELTGGIRRLIDQSREHGRDTVILIDDAAFTGSQLEIVRTLLSSVPGLRLVLFGPPELQERVARRRALAAALRHTVELDPMERDVTRTLLDTRIASMRVEPAGPDAEGLFTDEAVAIVTSWSAGNPGAVVRIASECILEAIASSQTIVDQRVAHRVARELTDHARQEARRAAAAPFVEPAVQTRLPFDSESDERKAEQ